jgi:Zn-dependent peptidase ImmA (M78 family)
MKAMTNDKQVDSFIRRLQKNVPVDIAGIAKVLGLEVYEAELPQGIAGKIFRDDKHGGKSEYSIIVRSADPYVRKRFTVAHEIAHYLLHRSLFSGKSLVDDAMYRSELSDRREAEANGLAADLLMPRHLLEPLKNFPAEDLARRFEVSLQAMQIRLGASVTQRVAS